jgi:putative Mg2+ transporter-C (MgtC) family protein
MVCRATDEAHIRTLLLTTISQSTVGLQSIRSEDIEGSDRTTVRAEVITSGPKHDTVEQIVTRLSFEPGIAAVSWSVVPTMME